MRILALILLISIPFTPALAEPTPSAGYSSPSEEQPTQKEEVKTEEQVVETSNVPPSEAVRPQTPEREKEVTTSSTAGGYETHEVTSSKETCEKEAKKNPIVNLREPNPVEKKNNANVTMLMGILAASVLGAYSIAKRKKKGTFTKVPAA
ncbi:hypothetical protein [Methanopyrus sp.]